MANKLTERDIRPGVDHRRKLAGKLGCQRGDAGSESYLQAALDVMQTNSLRKRTLDWISMRQKSP
jgi:hypothetical protein